MTDERQEAEFTTIKSVRNDGSRFTRTNPSVPSTKGISTRSKRFPRARRKASMIVDNSTGEIKGIGGMGSGGKRGRYHAVREALS